MNAKWGRFLLAATACFCGLFALMGEAHAQLATDKANAEITVIVPASAEVLFDGSPTTSRGTERTYLTPLLEPGKNYYYEVVARWTVDGKPVEQKRKVSVKAGARVRVDFTTTSSETGTAPKTAEIEKIAEEAFVYGFPMVMGYGSLYEFFVDKTSSQYKGPFNQVLNSANVFTPKDTAVVTPNSDTPYSMLAMDLRAEPLVLTVPPIEKGRYYSVQLVDLYTCNYGYIGSRATGNGGGNYLIAGPSWKGTTPEGIDKVFRCETELSIAIYRTQLFNPADIDNVKKIQAGYKIQPLSAFAKRPPPPSLPPEIKWPRIDKKLAETDPFAYLNFLLQFCPATGSAEVEKPLRARFAKIGIEPGKSFDPATLSADDRKALAAGMKAGLNKIQERLRSGGKDVNGWRVGAAFGDREFYKGDWTLRASAAMAGIFGNDAVEALYPMLLTDSEGKKPDGSKSRYTLTFAKGQLPPANAFWSVTMYDGKTQLLIENPINRYLINSPMLPNLKTNEDGSLTIYIQKDSPGKEKEANWLPAPDGPIFLVMRIYWPKKEALDGEWKPPAVKPVP
jgi:uncharacterized protein (TIGR03000 family)